MSSPNTNLPQFETALNEITELVNTMEKPDLSLEASLTHFERGISLVKYCQKIIAEAEQKVQILLQNEAGVAELKVYDELQNDKSE